jgi:hypothetical protein
LEDEEPVYIWAMKEATRPQCMGEDETLVICIITAHDDTNTLCECEFHAAQQHNMASGECLQTSESDHHCMAALVKVNGLEAYTLIDTGSTTASVTHNFA